jgi:hypothetical protein
VAAMVTTACTPSAPEEPELQRRMRRSMLEQIAVNAGEVVMADRPVPVPLVNSPCTVPVVQGIEGYKQVGWVGPHFFIVKSPSNPNGFALNGLPGGRARFTARFRSPRSEADARDLFRGEDGEHERILFCDVSATLDAVADSGVTRLAVWPSTAIRASIRLEHEYELTVDARDWASAQEITTSVVVDDADARLLQQELREGLGISIRFDMYGHWRRTGCLQVVRLSGIGITGLRDGETGAVPLADIKRAIRTVQAQSTDVSIDGECGEYFLANPISARDNGRSLSCRRGGDSLECRYEGEFQVTPAVFTTDTRVVQHDPRESGWR